MGHPHKIDRMLIVTEHAILRLTLLLDVLLEIPNFETIPTFSKRATAKALKPKTRDTVGSGRLNLLQEKGMPNEIRGV
jgi:hypothetical protein